MARPSAEQRRRRRRRAPASTSRPEIPASPTESLPAPIWPPPAEPEPPELAPAVPVPSEPEPPASEPHELPLATPEPVFAARALPPPSPPPLPAARRAVFFDVENTSRAEHVAHMIGHLALDHGRSRTDFVAVGNWRVIGPDTARLLAHHGAQLVHSAPSTGVRDWSDLRIAVSAGVWLAGARPGDALEIVSDDRAFDAVGDVAVSLGIAFRRLSYRMMGGVQAAVAVEAAAPAERSRRGGPRGRHGRRREPIAHHPPAHARPAPPTEAAHSGETPHTAPHDELIDVVRELVSRSPNGSVLIDTLANALKTRGFSRPPGSPRLITRLRRMRELSVSPNGMIRVLGGVGTDGDQAVVAEAPTAVEATVSTDLGAPPGPARRRRRSRRGGRRRRRSGPPPAGAA